MKLSITKEKRRFLLFLPLVAIPFLCLVFQTLGGGKGLASPKGTSTLGLNPQLPSLGLDLQKAFQDKLKTYEQADHDSLRKAQYQRQDPYRKDSAITVHRLLPSAASTPVIPIVADPRADQLEQRLARLRESIHQPTPAFHPAPRISMPDRELPAEPAPDPQLDRLNAMLDKVIRIQHPQEQPAKPTTISAAQRQTDEVLPADSNAGCIAAIVPENQTLVTGETITLRIIDPIRVGSRILPSGELVYGTVTLNNDRLLVHIGSLRENRSLYATDWQVVDLDGLTGIHIPGLLSREVAKQSADQGVNALNVMTLDPTLGAQAAGAGIQAAKSFLGHKVRQVRVIVRAGYQVLLRNPHTTSSRSKPDSTQAAKPGFPLSKRSDSTLEPPEWTPNKPALVHCRRDGIELTLRELCIKDSSLWFGLEWASRSPITFTPAYMRWTIRDRRSFKRTALQEQPLEPVTAFPLPIIGSDSSAHNFIGFHPFALSKDKELVLDIGEKGGGRTLALIIPHSLILKAKVYAKAGRQ